MNKSAPELASRYGRWHMIGWIVVLLIMGIGPFLFLSWAEGQEWFTGQDKSTFLLVAILWIPGAAIGWIAYHLVVYAGVRLTLPELQQRIVSVSVDNPSAMTWVESTEFETGGDQDVEHVMQRYIRLRRWAHKIIFIPVFAATLLLIIWASIRFGWIS